MIEGEASPKMKTCVYTALVGSYDGLIDQDVRSSSASDFICFTDDATLRSDVWDIRLIEPAFREDPVRSARLLKILGHEDLQEYDATLYIDASVRLRATPERILEEWLVDGAALALAAHSYRENLIDEFDEVIRLNYDDRARLYEQLVDYSLGYPEVLETKPQWTGMLARTRAPEVGVAMRVWADHVLRYSRRDQLSVMVALSTTGIDYRSIDMDNFNSVLHEWPVIEKRRISMGKAPAVPSGPLIAELRRARRSVAELTESLRTQGEHEAELRRDLSERQLDLESTAAHAVSERDALAQQLHRISGVRGAASHLLHNLRRRLRGGR